jgi:DNA-binding transcriptional LysR family regulator
MDMRAPLINPYRLITFYFVAREKSFTAAASNLCITQPAVSMQIKALEQQFGVKLIHVKKKRVHLTEEGELLLEQAAGVYHSSIAAERLLLHHGESGGLRIGVATALTLHLFPLVERVIDPHPRWGLGKS